MQVLFYMGSACAEVPRHVHVFGQAYKWPGRVPHYREAWHAPVKQLTNACLSVVLFGVCRIIVILMILYDIMFFGFFPPIVGKK